MLTDKELERLRNRASPNMSNSVRAANDMRARRKLIAWLEDSKDAFEIIQTLPPDQLKDRLSDADIFFLLNIVRSMMRIRKFMAVRGEIDDPEKWQAVGYETSRPADDFDILRSLMLSEHLADLTAFAGESFTGHFNPAIQAKNWSNFINDPEFADVFETERGKGKLNGIERINRAKKDRLDAYLNEILGKNYIEKEEPK